MNATPTALGNIPSSYILSLKELTPSITLKWTPAISHPNLKPNQD
jgi:hypothetical protein